MTLAFRSEYKAIPGNPLKANRRPAAGMARERAIRGEASRDCRCG